MAERPRRMSALESMASRLHINPASLKNTLQATVFRVKDTNGNWRSCSDEEFAALIIVADAYKLNPLLKEIYAYPAKGGGIVPLVSVDGWIRIMNDHPQYDGIEFEDLADEKGNLLAIEAVIWRKDRTRPTRLKEYLAECVENTDPWRKKPARMLRHKSLIQCARVAFGFSGIASEFDLEDGVVVADITPVPRRQAATAAVADEPFDKDTGEITVEGRGDDQMGEVHIDPKSGLEIDAHEAEALSIIERAGEIELLVDYTKLAEEAQPKVDVMTDTAMAAACNKALREARIRVTGK